MGIVFANVPLKEVSKLPIKAEFFEEAFLLASVIAIEPLYDISLMDIIINDHKITAPGAYTKKASNEYGVVMVPLRALANDLGFKVLWKSADEPLRVGGKLLVNLGVIPPNIDVAPELKDGITYVPLDFFSKVLGMNKAYVSEGKIIINHENK